jgi:hypothetical protein
MMPRRLHRDSSVASAAAWLAALVLALPLGARAHGDEDHSHAAAPATPAASVPPAAEARAGVLETPRRLAGGQVMLPKALQHGWQIRTLTLAPASVQPQVALQGRVVADPALGGRLQAPLAGVLEAPASGLPLPGQTVAAGAVLGWLRPQPGPLELSARQAEQADLAGRLLLARQRAERLAQLDGSVARKDIDAARSEAEALARQQAALGGGLARVPLRAPFAGVVAALGAQAGERLEVGAEVFTLMRPDRLMVEVLSADPSLARGLEDVRGEAAPGGAALKLQFAGAGRSLREGSLPLLFRVTGSPPLVLGQPVRLWARQSGPAQAALLIPEAALESRSGSDAARVWVHGAPELFEPRLLRIRPWGPGLWAVDAGLQAGERVVVQGAGLLGSVR